MESGDDASLDPAAQFNELKKNFTAALPGRVARIRELWKSIGKVGPFDTEFSVLNRNFHSLAGSSGVFGHARVGDLALELEMVTNHILHERAFLTQADVEQIDRRVEDLVKIVENAR